MDDQFNPFEPQGRGGQQFDQAQQFGQQQFDQAQQYGQQQFDQAQQYGQQQFDQAQQYGQQQFDQTQQYGQQFDQQMNQGFDPGTDSFASMQQMQYQSDSEPSFNPNFNMPSSSEPVPSAPVPPKKSKKGLIIGLSIAGVLLVAAALLIFVFDVFHIFKKKDSGSPEAVVKKFYQAINDADADKLMECVPKEAMQALGEYGGSKEDIQAALNMAKGFGIKIEDIKILSTNDISVDEAKQITGTSSLNISEAKKLSVSAVTKVNFMGQEESQEDTNDFICGKIDGKWYILNSGDGSDIDEPIDVPTEEPTETEPTTADGDPDTATESTTEAAKPGKETTPSKVVEVPAGLSDNIFDSSFALDGKVIKLPCAMADLESGWKLDDEISEADKNLEPKDSSGSYSLEKDGMNDDVYCYVGFVNDQASKINAKDGKIYYIDMDISWADDMNNVPVIVLPKGITWGSNTSDVKAAYGEPSYLSDDAGYDNIYMYYYDESYDHEVDLTFDREKGLQEIRITDYSIQYGN